MSQRKTIQTNGSIEIRIEQVEGDLEIIGWGQTTVEAESDDDSELTLDLKGSVLRVNCESDLSLRVPQSATITIEAPQGDVEINNVFSGIKIVDIQGDLELNNIGALSVSTVNGDLEANNIHGAVQLGTVEGDVQLNNVHGPCNVGKVEGDFSANNVHGTLEVNAEGDISVTNVHGNLNAHAGGDLSIQSSYSNINANVGGDASLRLAVVADTCRVHAGGDIDCRIPTYAGATVQLVAGGEINTRKIEEVPIFKGNRAEFTIGGGEGLIELTAGGDINLGTQSIGEGFNFEFDFGGKSGDEIAAAASEFTRNLVSQVENGLRSLTRTLDIKLSNLGTSEEIAGKVQEKVQNAMRRAEEKITEASKEAERRARDAEKRMAEMERRQQKGRPGVYWGTPPVPPPPPRPPKAKAPASEEERLMVLRMVSEGKISVEQAEQLLAALNG